MSFYVGRVKINIRLSFFVVSFIMIALNFSEQFFILAACTTLHEMAHILTARVFKLGCREITITPLGEMAFIDGMEGLCLGKRLLITAAGVIMNGIIAIFTSGALKGINIALVLLNILPMYPLDGGRMLHYILCYGTGVLRANKATVRISMAVAYAVVVLGFIQMVLYTFNVSLLCIGIYIIKINKKECIKNSYIFYKLLLNSHQRKIMSVRTVAVTGNMPVKSVLYRLGWDYYTVLYVGNGEQTRIINQTQLINHIINQGIAGTIGDMKEMTCD